MTTTTREKMNQQTTYDQYPTTIVLPIILFSITMYIYGAVILSRLHIIAAALYLIYAVAMEINVMNRSCRSCCYYGKRCAFGKGTLSAKLFTNKDPASFINRDVTIRTILPDFLIVILPILGGTIALILSFTWLYLAAIIIFAVIYFTITGAIRINLACNHCKQRELGCPAAEHFFKNQKPSP
jgi:hypothetical protein